MKEQKSKNPDHSILPFSHKASSIQMVKGNNQLVDVLGTSSGKYLYYLFAHFTAPCYSH
jgi:hypothetical protein